MSTSTIIQAPTAKPPTVLLNGPSGTGKTYSLCTFLDAGIDLFVLVTEANGVDTLLDAEAMAKKRGAIGKLHYHVVSPAAAGWSTMLEMADVVSKKDFEDIAKIKSGVGKAQTRQFTEFLKSCSDFVDDRTGEHFGDVTEWPSNRAFAIDSLSGINTIIMDQTIGYKPSAHQGEWGVAMNMQIKLLMKLTADLRCFFVLTAHQDKEPNELTGVASITVKALGRKNAPEINKMFSEIVVSKKSIDGKNNPTFSWSTVEHNTDTKNRGLALSSNLTPSFGQIVDIHRRRLANINSAT